MNKLARTIAAFSGVICMSTTVPSLSTTLVEPCSGVEDGPGDALPKAYYLAPFRTSEERAVPVETCAFIIIPKAGGIHFGIYPYELGNLRRLSKQTASQIFGKANSHEGFLTYHLVGFHQSEPNIFHVDLDFDKAGFAQRLRVRGFGINNPHWITIQKPEEIPKPEESRSSPQGSK